MAVCVIKLLEFVEIHKQKGQGLFIAVRPIYFFFKLSVKMPGIVKLREVVDYAQFLVSMFALTQHFFRFLTFGNVTVVNNYSFNNIIYNYIASYSF